MTEVTSNDWLANRVLAAAIAVDFLTEGLSSYSDVECRDGNPRNFEVERAVWILSGASDKLRESAKLVRDPTKSRQAELAATAKTPEKNPA